MWTKILNVGLTLRWNSVEKSLIYMKSSIVQMLFIGTYLALDNKGRRFVFIYLNTFLQSAIFNLILIKNNW